MDTFTKIIIDKDKIVKNLKKGVLKFLLTFAIWVLIIMVGVMFLYIFSSSSSHTKFNFGKALVDGLSLGVLGGLVLTVYQYYKKFTKKASVEQPKTTGKVGKVEVVEYPEKKENKFMDSFTDTFKDLVGGGKK